MSCNSIKGFVKTSETWKHLKITLFWDVTPYGLVKIYWHFGGTFVSTFSSFYFEDEGSVFFWMITRFLSGSMMLHLKEMVFVMVTALRFTGLREVWCYACVAVSVLSHVHFPANRWWQTAVTSLDQLHHFQASVQLVDHQAARKRSLHQLHQGPRTCFQKHSLPHLITHLKLHLHAPAWWVGSVFICTGGPLYSQIQFQLSVVYCGPKKFGKLKK